MITSWFAKAIYFEPNILLDKLSTYERNIKRTLDQVGSIRTEIINVDSTCNIQKNLFEIVELDGLRSILFERAQGLAKEIEYKDDITFNNVWTEVSKKGDYTFPRNFPRSVLSGIFCVKGDMKDGIKFFEGDNFQEIKLFTGSVVIFPSNVKYGMTSQLGDESILIHFTLK
tara:strand:+ start:6867 stop:7379 length:513 start_codon:yes stop_codon:yes gene_type:complete